ncbi:transcription repressor NadR [Clostridium sediminicola]|uniref:transcription repressor NadR n=1 Tax=Clostridium sediminicola TaxID=3114879 RepID=UPI0031F245C5
MNSKNRRLEIEKKLVQSPGPIKGQDLAKIFNVTRQVIVKDIAILRAAGKEIIATPDGYLINTEENKNIKKIIATSHNKDEIENELKCIVKYGGIINDVIVEHPVYGEIKANLMLKNYFDIENLVNRIALNNAQPLSSLTKGIHLHTIEAESEEILDKILNKLDKEGYLIK